MRLVLILPYVALLVVGQAALDAVPGVVAEREGGMGLGSALIVAHVVQLAGTAAGAVAAAYLIDRRFAPLVLLAGALVYYAGLVAVAMAPMGALSWIVVALGLAGIGFGSILTVAFSVAAGVVTPPRPLGIMWLLLAPVGARSVVGVAVVAGMVALTLVAAIVVAISLLLARFAGRSPRTSLGPPSADQGTGRWLAAREAVVGGTLLAVGVGLALGGADPSRVSGAVMAGMLGLGDLRVLDAARAGMVIVGLALVVGGSIVLLAPQRPSRPVLLAVATTALAAIAAGGTMAALSLAVRFGGASPADRAVVNAGVAALGGSALGLVLGGWWLMRGGRPRTVAVAGTLTLAVVTAFGLVALRASTAPPDISVHFGALAVIGLGGGLAASALRLLLAEVAVHQRGLAAAAGVVAASFGSALGSMIGTGEGITFVTRDPDAIAAGVIVLAGAAIAAVTIVAWLPSSRPARR